MPHFIGSPGYNRAHDRYLTPPEPRSDEVEVNGFECDADLEDLELGEGECDFEGDLIGTINGGNDLQVVCPKCGTEHTFDPEMFFD